MTKWAKKEVTQGYTQVLTHAKKRQEWCDEIAVTILKTMIDVPSAKESSMRDCHVHCYYNNTGAAFWLHWRGTSLAHKLEGHPLPY